MQKKQYVKPEFNTYGSVEQLTQASGRQSLDDSVIFNTTVLTDDQINGSADFIIKTP